MSSAELVDVLVEIPKGSQNKYEWDKQRQRVRLDRVLHSSMHYPTDYGFVPETLAEDGDPIDVLLLVTTPTVPGCMAEGRVIGCLHMRDEHGPDTKLLCVSTGDPRLAHIAAMSDVPSHTLKEIAVFFKAYKELEDKTVEVTGWGEVEEAISELNAARQRCVSKR